MFTRRDLENKIKEIYEIDTIPHLIDTQITKYVMQGYTFLEIARALVYFYAIKDGDLSKTKGIGIVPYIMNEAKQYFAQEAARVQRQMEQSKQYKNEPRTIDIICKTNIKKPERKKPFIDLSGIEVDDE